MKNNNKVEIFAGNNAPDSRLGMLWLDNSDSTPYLKIVENSGKTKIVGGSYFELTTSLSESSSGKALDAVSGKTIFDMVSQINEDVNLLNANKYPKLQNGNSSFTATLTDTVQNSVAMGFSLSGANLYTGDLTNASLINADLSNANLVLTALANVDLTNASLSNTNLTSANFYQANLTSANLSNTNLTGAILYGANLTNANLTDANLTSANFYQADLTNSYGLNSDINIALADVMRNPMADSNPWTLTWKDGSTYSCDPSTGLFTLAS